MIKEVLLSAWRSTVQFKSPFSGSWAAKHDKVRFYHAGTKAESKSLVRELVWYKVQSHPPSHMSNLTSQIFVLVPFAGITPRMIAPKMTWTGTVFYSWPWTASQQNFQERFGFCLCFSMRFWDKLVRHVQAWHCDLLYSPRSILEMRCFHFWSTSQTQKRWLKFMFRCAMPVLLTKAALRRCTSISRNCARPMPGMSSTLCYVDFIHRPLGTH